MTLHTLRSNTYLFKSTNGNQMTTSTESASLIVNVIKPVVEEPVTQVSESHEDLAPPAVVEPVAPAVTETEIDKPVVENKVASPVVATGDIIAPISSNEIIKDDLLTSNQLANALDVLHSKTVNQPKLIADAQVAFYNVITRVLIRKTEDDAFSFLSNILSYIYANIDNEFSVAKRYREFNALPNLTKGQQLEFQILLGVLVDTANPSTRLKNARSMNWVTISKQLQPATAEFIVLRLKKYYNVA